MSVSCMWSCNHMSCFNYILFIYKKKKSSLYLSSSLIHYLSTFPSHHKLIWQMQANFAILQRPPLMLSCGIPESKWGTKDDGKGLMVNEVALLQPKNFLQLKNNFVPTSLLNGPFLPSVINVPLHSVFHIMTSNSGLLPHCEVIWMIQYNVGYRVPRCLAKHNLL